MLPDLRREETTGWLTFSAVLLAMLITWWTLHDNGELAAQVDQARAAWQALTGAGDLKQLVDHQRQANQELRATIAERMQAFGFKLDPRFVIPANERQPGYFFIQRFIAVRQALREKAQPYGVEYQENLGFGDAKDVPDDKDAPYLMTMLQLTEKAVGIALAANEPPLESFSITHERVVETGPAGRPVLLREYPLTLKVRGSLKDILWILHRLSQFEADGKDYPLILRGLTIQSEENAKPKDNIQPLDAVFQLAGMQFLTPEERILPGKTSRALPGKTGRTTIHTAMP
jgi:hypothetical protein